MQVYSSTIARALYGAIKDRRVYERTVLKYTGDSIEVAVWQQTLDAIQNGEHIEVIQHD